MENCATISLLRRSGAGTRVMAVIAALMSGAGSVARADSVPRTHCGAISPRVIEVRTDGDFTQLTDRERSNLSYYLSRLKAAGEPVPSRLYLYRSSLVLEPAQRMSLIFPFRDCDEKKCIGTAVLPGESGTELKRFSYRRNMIVEPYLGATRASGQYYERDSRSYVFMDESERRFIAFHDVWRFSTNVAWSDFAAISKAQAVRSEARLLDLKREKLHPARPYYPFCFGNMFEADGPFVIPYRQPRTGK